MRDATASKRYLDKTGLVDESVFGMVSEAWEGVKVGEMRTPAEVAKAVYSKARVAAKYGYELGRWDKLGTHQKQKVLQDLLCGALLEPEVFTKLVEKAMSDPTGLLKAVVAFMPKELNVESREIHGVIMVPVRSTDAGDWQKLADQHLGQVVSGQSEAPWMEGVANGR